MELIIYNKVNTGTQIEGKRSINMNLSNGNVSFSKAALNEMDLQPFDKVIFAQDGKNKKNWFVAKADNADENAFSLSEVGKNKDTKTTLFRSKGLIRKLLAEFKQEKNISFLISKEYKEVEGTKFYQLIPYK